MKKRNVNKLICLAASLAMACSLAACSGGGTTESQNPENSQSSGEVLKIGIIQYAAHPSLDNCTEGFIQGLAEAGFVDGENIQIDLQNAQGQQSTSDTMAQTMAASNYDMIVGVATPSAMSAYAAAKEQGIPVVFTAVNDPVGAGIVQSMDAPGTIATGTSDALNLEGQLQMIRAFLPDAKTIGILYTTSEPNSVANLEAFQELAPQYGFEVVAQGITSENEVANGAAALVAKGVDCVNNFTDNNVVNNLGVLLHETDAAGIPVFGSEIEQVKNGCVASESLDYVALGVQTGQMAAEILNGADPAGMAVQVIDSSEPCYSQANCDKLGVTVPADYASASNVDTEAE